MTTPSSSSHTSHWPCSPLLSYFLTPIFPPIRPLAVSRNFWIGVYLSSRSCNDKYPYCRAQCRMFQQAGGKDFRVLVCVERHERPSPPSWLRRWDHRQDVVLRAYSCRLSMTDFHYCNCTLITPHSMCVLTCVITYLCVPTYVHMWDSTADQEKSTAGNWREVLKFFSLYRSRSVSKVTVFLSCQWFIQLCCGAFPPGLHSPCYNATIHHPVNLERLSLKTVSSVNYKQLPNLFFWAHKLLLCGILFCIGHWWFHRRKRKNLFSKCTSILFNLTNLLPMCKYSESLKALVCSKWGYCHFYKVCLQVLASSNAYVKKLYKVSFVSPELFTTSLKQNNSLECKLDVSLSDFFGATFRLCLRLHVRLAMNTHTWMWLTSDWSLLFKPYTTQKLLRSYT